MKLFMDQVFMDQDRTTLETLAAVIAHSQIVVARVPRPTCLPAGLDAADVAVLDWIVAEGRRLGRGIAQM
jgi:hypothetical protein